MTVSLTKRPKGKHKARIVQSLLRTWGSDCWICGTRIDMNLDREASMAYTIDHVRPISVGGTNRLENLRLAHRDCNEFRGNTGAWR